MTANGSPSCSEPVSVASGWTTVGDRGTTDEGAGDADIAPAPAGLEGNVDAEGNIDADGTGDGDATALGSVIPMDFAICGFGAGTGWIDTYCPSQTIRFGAYHHVVKKPRNCLTVSDLPGRMS